MMDGLFGERMLTIWFNTEQNGENTTHDSPSAERSTTFSSATPSIIHELDRQLEEWRMCLPPGFEFAAYSSETQEFDDQNLDQRRPVNERLRSNLMARYFAAKSIIHRPYIYRALYCGHGSILSEEDQNGARTAIGSALMCTLCSEIFHEPLPLVLHPINACRRYGCEPTIVSLLTCI